MFGRIIEILKKSPIVADYEINQLIEECSASFLRVQVTLLDGSHLFIKELKRFFRQIEFQWKRFFRRLLLKSKLAPIRTQKHETYQSNNSPTNTMENGQMHILLIHQIFMSNKEAGGTRHLELAKYLVRWGHRFTVIASTVSYLTSQVSAHCRGHLFTHENIDGITIWRAFTYSKLHKSFVSRILSFLSFMFSSFVAGLRVRNIDIVLGTSPPIFQGISAYLLSRLKRVPFVFEVRDLWPDFAIEMGVLRNPLLIWMSRRLEVFLYRHADLIIVNSPGFISHLRCYTVPAEKIALVPNSVEVEMFNPSDRGEEVRRELNLDGKFVVLYAGAHGPANDLDTLLKAAKLLKEYDEIVFVLVGDGKERPKLMRQAEKLQLWNVRFVPAQPKVRMPAFLAAADVCIAILKNIPMFTTTYPNKVFDYMAAGRPTLLAIDGVIRQVIEDADGGIFVQPGNPEALANGLLTLYENPCLRGQQGMNARNYVATHFDRSEQALKLETAIHGACQGRKKNNTHGKC